MDEGFAFVRLINPVAANVDTASQDMNNNVNTVLFISITLYVS